MGFIRDFAELLFGLGQLKAGISTCGLCPQVKMLFMNHFTSTFIEPLLPPQVFFSLSLSLFASEVFFFFFQFQFWPPTFFDQAVKWGQVGREREETNEVWDVYTPTEGKGSKHFLAYIMDS